MPQGHFARSVLARYRREHRRKHARKAVEVSTPAEARDELKIVANALRRQKVALQLISKSLSQTSVEGEGFDVARELAAAAECVRNDLLTDAIETLDVLSELDDEALRRRFAERWAIHVEF